MNPAPAAFAAPMSFSRGLHEIRPYIVRSSAWYVAVGWGTVLTLWWIAVGLWYVTLVALTPPTIGLIWFLHTSYRGRRRRQRLTGWYCEQIMRNALSGS